MNELFQVLNSIAFLISNLINFVIVIALTFISSNMWRLDSEIITPSRLFSYLLIGMIFLYFGFTLDLTFASIYALSTIIYALVIIQVLYKILQGL